jgi:hypothetical protein
MTITTTPIRDRLPRFVLAALGGLVLLVGLMPALAHAQTFKVTRTDDPSPGACAPGDCSLREAVIASNGAGGPDKIKLPADNYRLSIPGAGSDTQGDLDLLDDVRISGVGGLAIIDGNGLITGDRVFEVSAGAQVQMKRLRVAFGQAPIDGDSVSRGGGIRVNSGSGLVFSKGFIHHNQTDPSVIGNGGGIYNEGDLTMIRSTVLGNEASVPSFGGGIATQGGGSTEIVASTVRNNTGTFGGGLSGSGAVADPTSLKVVRSTLNSNSAGLGGAIYGGGSGAYGFTVEIDDSTLAKNTGADKGGAIRLRNGSSLAVAGSTITENTADSSGDGLAGAISMKRDADATVATLVNTIVAANIDLGPSSIPDCQAESGAVVISAGHNLVGNANGCGLAPNSGDLIGSAGSPIDPLLGNLADNGGPATTTALLSGSPAINAGDPATPGSGGTACSATDERGVHRSACDIGAYERTKCAGVLVNRVGTGGSDVLKGTAGADGFLAFGGRDVIRARAGADALCAGRGRDRLIGGAGSDALRGGRGTDACLGGSGHDSAASCEVRRSIP